MCVSSKVWQHRSRPCVPVQQRAPDSAVFMTIDAQPSKMWDLEFEQRCKSAKKTQSIFLLGPTCFCQMSGQGFSVPAKDTATCPPCRK